MSSTDNPAYLNNAVVDAWVLDWRIPLTCGFCGLPIGGHFGNFLTLRERVRDHAAVCKGDDAELFRTEFDR